jgi:hypothetical protein
MPSPVRALLMILAAATLAQAGDHAAAAACSAQSPAHRVAVLELYTSEGCSSCPPADEWVSALPAAGFGPAQVVTLAFHVDYWNYLGWTDRYAQPAFTERQRQLSAANGISFVYTPALALNGRVLRGLSHAKLRDAVDAVNRTPPGADLAVRATSAAGALAVEVDATLRDPAATDAVLVVAVTESGLATEVKRGENAGRVLRHDFVVRAWRGPHRVTGSAPARLRVTFPAADFDRPADANVVALVQNRRTGEVLQSLSLPPCPPS